MRVYREAIQMNRQLALVAPMLERNDRDLLKQLKRAAASVPLNLAEGLGCKGGNRELRFLTALGSAREVLACVEVAFAWGYFGEREEFVRRDVDRMVGMLVNLTRAR